MHARLFPLWGALLLGALGGIGCNDKGPPGGPPPPPVDPATDGGTQPMEDGGITPGRSDFACDVARQRGCGAGQTCLFRQIGDGGTGSGCFSGPCDPVAQNCPNGLRCTYARGEDGGTVFRACVPEGTVDELGPCQLARSSPLALDTCKKGLFCVDMAQSDGGTAFQCARFCHGTPTCAAPSECNEVLRLNGTSELPLICGAPSARCDVLTQDCEAPLSCYPGNGNALCATTGNLGEGAPCEFSNQCARGSACVRTGAGLTCRTLCRLPSGQPSCPSGRQCEALQGIPGAGACIP